MADEQDRSEALDGDKLEDIDFPPDEPLGVDEYGTTAAEERVDEPLEERARREEPEARPPRHGDEGVQLVDNTADAPDGAYSSAAAEIDAGETGDEMEGRLAEDDPGPDAFDGEFDRVPLAAEEAAMHIVEGP